MDRGRVGRAGLWNFVQRRKYSRIKRKFELRRFGWRWWRERSPRLGVFGGSRQLLRFERPGFIGRIVDFDDAVIDLDAIVFRLFDVRDSFVELRILVGDLASVVGVRVGFDRFVGGFKPRRGRLE